MDKNEEKAVRDAVAQGLMDIGHGFHTALAKVEDPSVAALILSGVEGVTMSAENGTHVFRPDPGPFLEELIRVAASGQGMDQVGRLQDLQHSLQNSRLRAVESIAAAQRAVEAAARLWRPVNVVVAGVRDDGCKRQ